MQSTSGRGLPMSAGPHQGSRHRRSLRYAARVACGILGSLLLAACGAEPAGVPRGPNLLLVTIDTIRVDHTSAYGYPRNTTPTLEKLAEGGVQFDDVYAPMATTGPSHASLLTSLYPRDLGYLNNYQSLETTNPTLSEILSAQGFETAAVVSSTPLKRASGLARGFRSFDEDFADGGEEKRRARDTTARAERWLRNPSSEPFFLWVHYFDPHWPYRPPWTQLIRLAPVSLDRFAWGVAKYDADLRYTDDELGRLLGVVEELGLLENTLVAVTGDHGEGLMTHGFQTHGPLLFEEDVKVPLIFYWPSRLAPIRLPGPAELRDVPRTVLELLQIPAPPALQGRSLVPAMTGAESLPGDHAIFLQRRTYESDEDAGIRVSGEKFGIRSGRWKYLEALGEGTRELFDLERDPGERHNLADVYPEQARDLSDRLQRYVHRPTKSDASLEPWSAEDVEQLEALGYVR
jgi:arylsulfatase A-like enzyme